MNKPPLENLAIIESAGSQSSGRPLHPNVSIDVFCHVYIRSDKCGSTFVHVKWDHTINHVVPVQGGQSRDTHVVVLRDLFPFCARLKYV